MCSLDLWDTVVAATKVNKDTIAVYDKGCVAQIREYTKISQPAACNVDNLGGEIGRRRIFITITYQWLVSDKGTPQMKGPASIPPYRPFSERP